MNSWTETATVYFLGLFLVHDLAKISGGSITNPEVNGLTPHPEESITRDRTGNPGHQACSKKEGVNQTEP